MATADNSNRRLVTQVTEGLCLAAMPTFALLAILTFMDGAGDMPCMGMQSAPVHSGMGLMYALMSAFHAVPWLRLIAGRRPYS